MIKLIITDMDNTFLDHNGNFNNHEYHRVQNIMVQHHVTFAVCTGKQCERVEELFGSAADNLWILGDSAARIKHHGQYVADSLMPNTLGLQIINRLEAVAPTSIIIACTPTGAFVTNQVAPTDFNHIRDSYTRMNRIGHLQALTEDFVKLTVYDPHLQCDSTVKKLMAFADRAFIVASDPAWIDITNHGVHKGTTVAHLQKLLNVTPAETMVFGDGLNDLELMTAGDFSFAMRNAIPLIKKTSRFVTLSNDENGVLQTIAQILSLQP